ncbi:MAG: hypothetical protein J6A21_11865 [Lentisphaeria bacterium]|nr:hypothetical protein [Lentisphaeria bacterium]
MKTERTLILALLAGTSLLSGAELFKAEKAQDFNTGAPWLTVKEDVLSFNRKGGFIGNKFLPLSGTKKYKISAEVRSVPGTDGKMTVYLGFQLYDKDNKRIDVTTINGIPETAAVLAADAKEGDTVLKIKDGTKWINSRKDTAVAFEAKEDYSDLPNTTLVGIKKGSIRKGEDVWTLELMEPLKKAYSAGTKVRQHKSGGTYFYAVTKDLTFDWQKVESPVFSGMAKFGDQKLLLWPGTVSGKALFMVLGPGKNVKTEARNIKVEEVE